MDKVLCVDDDANVTSALMRTFHQELQISTASSGEEGLLHIKNKGPFAVIISDNRMPGMGGVRFLARAAEVAPDSARIMLTGYADVKTAIEAINQGHIFRFLTKPIAPDELRACIMAAIEHHRLVTSERVLLRDTLNGCVKMLVDLLSLTSSLTFIRSNRIRHYAGGVVAGLKLSGAWQFNMAAMLSQVGCIAIPSTILEKYESGQDLSPSELEILRNHPAIGSAMISRIPRMEAIAEMIGNQFKPVAAWRTLSPAQQQTPAIFGAQLLRAATEYDLLLSRGVPQAAVVMKMASNPEVYNQQIVSALARLPAITADGDYQELSHRDLKNGMIIAEDVRSQTGILLLCKGHEINDIVRHRLANFARQEGIDILVKVIANTRAAGTFPSSFNPEP